MAAGATAPGGALRVVYLSGPLTAGGAERELVNQVKTLQQRGHRATVLTLGEGDPLEREVRATGARLVHAGAGGSRWRRVLKMVQVVRDFEPDVVHSQHFYVNLYARLVGVLAGVPSIGSLQSDLHFELENHPLIGHASYRWMPWMTANSKLTLRRLREAGYGSERSFHLVNAVDMDALDAEAEASDGDPAPWQPGKKTLVIVGRLIEVKRHDRFFEIIKALCEEGHDVQGIVVGDGPERAALESRADAMGLRPHVRFLGLRLDVPVLLSRADVALLCSDHEGMPNVVQEAMACGVPVVSARVGAVPEMIRDEKDGFIVEKDDVPAYVRRAAELLGDEKRRQRMGEAARQHMKEQFSLAHLGRTLERIYRRVKRSYVRW